MVNPGKPSTGCAICRGRRVKCDERPGGCFNCQRYGVRCPGYPDPGEIMFRRTNIRPVLLKLAGTLNKDARSGGSTALPGWTNPNFGSSRKEIAFVSGDSRAEQEKPSLSDAPSTNQGHLQISVDSKLLSEDLEQRCDCALLTVFNTYSRVHNVTEYNFLTRAINRAKPGSCLREVLATTSLTNFGNRYNSQFVVLQDKLALGRAIAKVNAALEDPERCLEDTTLVSVWLLQIKEILQELAPTAPGIQSDAEVQAARARKQSHVDGTIALLRFRGERQFATGAGRQLFKAITQGMHWKALFACEMPSEDLQYIESMLPKTGLDMELAKQLRQYFNMVTFLRYRVRTFLQNPAMFPTREKLYIQVESLLDVVDQLVDEGVAWRDDTLCWQPCAPFLTQEERTRHSDKLPYLKHHFLSWTAYLHWNRYLVGTALLHEVAILLLSSCTAWYTASTPAQNGLTLDQLHFFGRLLENHRQAFRRYVTDFIGLIGYAFGDLDRHGQLRDNFSRADSPSNIEGRYEINVAGVFQVYPPFLYFTSPHGSQFLDKWQKTAIEQALKRMKEEFIQP